MSTEKPNPTRNSCTEAMWPVQSFVTEALPAPPGTPAKPRPGNPRNPLAEESQLPEAAETRPLVWTDGLRELTTQELFTLVTTIGETLTRREMESIQDIAHERMSSDVGGSASVEKLLLQAVTSRLAP